ncbi:hypothetical protein [Pseudonocardia xishanensis]|uniref:Uncharacterized protein n=1 Tax=Pseudonocardia xishanensis TaxID=630995 RepID=A0ABP8RW08_9PSEU
MPFVAAVGGHAIAGGAVLAAAAVLDRAVAVAVELAESAPADAFALTKRQLRHDGVVRIADSDLDEVLAMWCRRVEDGWTARYLQNTVGGR